MGVFGQGFQVTDSIVTGTNLKKITKGEALSKMSKSNEALYLEGINNCNDAEEWVDSVVREAA